MFVWMSIPPSKLLNFTFLYFLPSSLLPSLSFSLLFIHSPTSTKGLPTAKHWSEHKNIYNRMYFQITVSISSSEHKHIFLNVCTSGNVKVHWTFGSSDRSAIFWEKKGKERSCIFDWKTTLHGGSQTGEAEYIGRSSEILHMMVL